MKNGARSHPEWVRGLKPYTHHITDGEGESHPEWVRGLKLRRVRSPRKGCRVAPRVGAWIETKPPTEEVINRYVAPRVGAWIETLGNAKELGVEGVAPRVGAWIET